MNITQRGGGFALMMLAIVLFPGCGGRMTEEPAEAPDIFSRESILSAMESAFDWQIDNIVYSAPLPDGGFQDVSDTEWVRGAFLMEISERNGWQPGPRPRHADDHCIAQTYAKIFLAKRDPRMIEATVARFDEMIFEPRPGPDMGWAEDDNWSWCDALFMAPPTMALIAEATGDSQYLDLMNTMWWETYDYLYDPEEHLWYRDGRYVIQTDGSGPRTPSGQKVFWSRGNGWVFAGLALVLERMPTDYPERARYEALFQDMAATLIRIQGEDGLWRSSLLDPDEYPIPESSGSGFFVYGLAWGLNNGALDSSTYQTAVREGWRGLNWALQPSGKLGWVQQIGYDPRSVTADDSMEYGSGAFLLAGSEMLTLASE